MRFGREVASARRVSGVFTAMVVDADVDGPAAWLATAYVPGPSLSEAVDEHGPLPAESLLTLAAGLAESLSAIHAAGVVHRDLKPSNVLLAEDGPRVIDFGISRAVESTALTQAGLVIGSPGFMSPEQAMGYEVGPPSRHLQPGGGPRLRRHGPGPVRHRDHGGAAVPRGPRLPQPGSGAGRGAAADRALPGQGSRASGPPPTACSPRWGRSSRRRTGCPNRSSARSPGIPRQVPRRRRRAAGFGSSPAIAFGAAATGTHGGELPGGQFRGAGA